MRLFASRRLAARMAKEEEIEKAIQLAMQRAVEERKKLGLEVVVWQDGKVVRLQSTEPEPRGEGEEHES